MFLDGLDTDTKLGGDLFVGAAFGDELQHFCLARGQVIGAAFDRLPGHIGLAALVSQAFSDSWTEERIALKCFANRLEQIVAAVCLTR